MGYFRSSATLNYIRVMMSNINEEVDLANAKSAALDQHMNMDNVNRNGMRNGIIAKKEYHTSHEALLLAYEDALTREIDGKIYNLSAPFIWIGDRTRQVDHAHIHYATNIENPIGIKIGPSMTSEELINLLKFVWKDPEQTPGKVTLITRYGIDKVIE